VRIRRALLLGTGIVAISAMSMLPAYADDQSSGPVETVVVTGIRKSLQDSLVMKRNSDLITENISTKDIGQLPDVTIAEELNRLPGLNTTLDRGNASQAAVRGLGPRLVLGLVNGREVASSEPDQNVRWEIYPSEVVSAVQVFKSQSADLISGGIAATIDIKTIAPLDYEGPSLQFRAGPEYNEEATELPDYSPWGFRGSAAYIDHLTSTFAVSVAGSFQREKNGYESFQGWGYNLADGGTAGDVTGDGVPDSTPWGAQTEATEIQQDRMALSGAAQWRPTSNIEVKADALYSAYTIHEDQFQQWYGRNNNMGDYTYPQNDNWCGGSDSWAYDCVSGTTGTPDNLIVQNGVISGGTFRGSYFSNTNVIANYRERHTLAVGGLNVKWTPGEWVVTGDLSHSEAWRNNSWESILTESYPTSAKFNWSNGVVPSYQTYSDYNATQVYNPSDVTNQWTQDYLPGNVDGPEHTMDNLSAAQLDATKPLGGSLFSALDVGVRYAGRVKSHTMQEWDECPTKGAVSVADFVAAGYSCGAAFGTGGIYAQLPQGDLGNFTIRDFNAPTMLDGNFDALASALFPNYSNGWFSPPSGGGTDVLPQHWRVAEDTFEGYAKLDLSQDVAGIPMTGDAGVRVVNVSSKSDGYLTTDGTNYLPSSSSKSYTDVLPSLALNFHIDDERVLRFGAAIAVSRPPLDELRIGNSLSTSAPFVGSQGNPNLNPYRADQVDLDYEWYFHPEAMLAVAGYYKHLESFIGYQTHQQMIDGNNYTIAQPVNGKGGDLEGLELTFQTRFYFLPSFLQDFGVYSNYAYVNSELHEFTPVGNPLEATGLAKHTAEADLWYYRDGFEARLAYKVHSPFTVIAGWDAQSLTRLDWERTLDASMSYQWNEHVGLRFQARNLTNEVSRSYWDNNPSELARYDTFGRSYLFDVSYKN
jgi:TonB-dependent receptor